MRCDAVVLNLSCVEFYNFLLMMMMMCSLIHCSRRIVSPKPRNPFDVTSATREKSKAQSSNAETFYCQLIVKIESDGVP
jgi:hypothetical protein